MNAFDQANHLRQWIAERHQQTPAQTAQPKLVVVGSGKGGVGVSTLAVGLSLALARDGRRTVLVDADFEGGDAAELCGLEDCGGLADVLAGRRTVHEVLQPATSGLHVLPGTRGLPNLAECSAA